MLTKKPSLEGCEAKFGRGKAHAQRLRSEITTVLNKDAYTLRIERDEDALQHIFYVEQLPTIGDDWGLIFGDAVHNFRATLDHLVVQLAIVGQERALTEEEIRSSEFPVLYESGKWQQVAGPRGVRLLRTGERERIRELQPFNASDRSIWGPQAFSGARIPRLIEVLHRIDIDDKHRFVHPSWFTVSRLHLPDLPGVRSAWTVGERLEIDAEAGRWTFDGPLPELPANIDAESYFPMEVAFADIPRSTYPLLYFLGEVEWMVTALIEMFRPAISAGNPAEPIVSLPISFRPE